MSQEDFNITTADANTGITMRAAINAALQALASTNSGPTAPVFPYAYQMWANTTNNVLQMRNGTNTAWINMGPLSGFCPVASASGTADVIVAHYTPAIVTLTDKLRLDFIASGANLTTTPSFQADSTTAYVITKKGGSALDIADIPAAGARCELSLDLPNTRYELMNPAVSAGGGGATKAVIQASHGFVIGDILYYTGAAYAKAKADAIATAEVVGIVSASTPPNNFTLLNVGYVSSLTGLTAGTVYFLSDTVAGALTATEPTIEGHVSKPLLVADSTTSGYFFNMRGAVVGGGSTAYVNTFDNTSLVAGVLTVTHNFGHQYPNQPVVIDNAGKVVIPDEVTYTTINALTIDLSSYGVISGTWRVVVLDSGATTTTTPFATAAEIITGTEAAKAIAPDQLRASEASAAEITTGTAVKLITADQLKTAGIGANVLVQHVYTETGSMAYGSTAFVYDDTIPEKTEGNEFMTLAITPTSATNKLIIDVVISGTRSAATVALIVALFQDAVTNALATSFYYTGIGGDTNAGNTICLRHIMVAGTTSATTFKVRAGAAGISDFTFNGSGAARKFGGAFASSISIQEIKV